MTRRPQAFEADRYLNNPSILDVVVRRVYTRTPPRVADATTLDPGEAIEWRVPPMAVDQQLDDLLAQSPA